MSAPGQAAKLWREGWAHRRSGWRGVLDTAALVPLALLCGVLAVVGEKQKRKESPHGDERE